MRQMLRDHVANWAHVEMSEWSGLIAAAERMDDASRARLARRLAAALDFSSDDPLPYNEPRLWQAIDGLLFSATFTEGKSAETIADGFGAMSEAHGWPMHPLARAHAMLMFIRLGGRTKSSTIIGDEAMCRAAPRLALEMLALTGVAGETLGLLLAGWIRAGVAGRTTAIGMIATLWRALRRDAYVNGRQRAALYALIGESFGGADREKYLRAVSRLLRFDPAIEDEKEIRTSWEGVRRELLTRHASSGFDGPALMGAALALRSAARIRVIGSDDGRSDRRPVPEVDDGEFTLPVTYNGLIDDVMFRFDPSKLTPTYFRGMIAKNIFFSDKVLLNDGYLMNHPIARQELQRDNSLLRNMLNRGFVRILSREDPEEALIQTPTKMAERGVHSFRQLIESDEWPDFRNQLQRISRNLVAEGRVRRWPGRDLSKGYVHLAGRLFDKAPEDLGLAGNEGFGLSRMEIADIGGTFLRANPESGAARTKLEQAAEEILVRTRPRGSAQFAEAMRRFMEIANQCYHYNFGLALEADRQDAAIAVDTTVGLAFEDLLDTKDIYQGVLSEIPLINLPQNLSLEDGSLFNAVLDPSSRVGTAKRLYMMALKRTLTQAAVATSDGRTLRLNDLLTDLQEAGWQYMSEIGEHFAAVGGKRWYMEQESTIRNSPLLLAGDEHGIEAASGPVGMIAVRIMDLASKGNYDVMLENFRLVSGTDPVDPDQSHVFKLGDVSPRATSVAFSKHIVDEYAGAVPAMVQ
jgi:hypothetical protein